jgi:hypothetical protein
MLAVIEGLDAYCRSHGIARVADLTGAVRIDPGLTDQWLRLAQQSG